MGCCLIHEILNKANEIFIFTWLNFGVATIWKMVFWLWKAERRGGVSNHASASKASAKICCMSYMLTSHLLKQTTQPSELTKVNWWREQMLTIAQKEMHNYDKKKMKCATTNIYWKAAVFLPAAKGILINKTVSLISENSVYWGIPLSKEAVEM